MLTVLTVHIKNTKEITYVQNYEDMRNEINLNCEF